MLLPSFSFLFFSSFIYLTTAEIYTLSLHDALPIFPLSCYIEFARGGNWNFDFDVFYFILTNTFVNNSEVLDPQFALDRKSTRLNSSHLVISYAVFCLKKKNIVDKFTAENFTLQRSV